MKTARTLSERLDRFALAHPTLTGAIIGIPAGLAIGIPYGIGLIVLAGGSL